MIMLDAKGSVITPALARRFRAQIEREYGDFTDDFWVEMHPSQNVEWENCRIAVQQIIRGTDDPNLIPPAKFLDFPLALNQHLSPTVILLRKHMSIVGEIARLGFTNWREDALVV